MKISIIALVSLALATSCHPTTLHDTGIHCINSSPGTCSTSLYSLLSNHPSNYGGTGVWVGGYLGRRGELFYLFPSKDWLYLSYLDHAVQIAPRGEGDLKLLKKLTGKPIFVVGTVNNICLSGCWGTISLTKEPYEIAIIGDVDL